MHKRVCLKTTISHLFFFTKTRYPFQPIKTALPLLPLGVVKPLTVWQCRIFIKQIWTYRVLYNKSALNISVFATILFRIFNCNIQVSI